MPESTLLRNLTAEDRSAELLAADWAVEDSTNLYHLCRQTLGFTKMAPRPHADLCDFLTNSGKYAGRLHNKCKLVLVPRGTYKTTIGSTGLPIQRLLVDPNARILLDGEVADKSVDILRGIRGILATNEMFQQLHGRWFEPLSREAQEFVEASRKPLTWSEDAIVVGTRTDFSKREPSIKASGIDVVEVGKHYDLVIGDDYHSELNITSRERIDKVIRRVQLMINILDPGAQYIIIGTRWDEHDAYGWIIRDIEGLRINEPGVYRGKLFDVIVYPWRWGAADAYHYFAPTIWDEETIQPVRKMLSPYLFSCQMENNPIDEASACFKLSWLKYCDPADIPKHDVARFTAIDPAVGLGDRRDYSAIVTVAYDSDMKRYLLDVNYGRWNEERLVEEVIATYQTYKPLQIAFEAVSGFKAYETLFREICRRKKVYLPIQFLPRDTTQSKPNRIRALAPVFQSGDFYIARGCRGQQEFLDEYKRYGHSKSFDDVLDALADVETLKWFPGSAEASTEPEYEPLDQLTGY